MPNLSLRIPRSAPARREDGAERNWQMWLTAVCGLPAAAKLSEHTVMARPAKLSRAIRDKRGTEISTREEAKRYVLGKLRKRPNSQSWDKAAELLLEDASAEAIDKQLRLALLLEGDLDLRDQ
jgi:hypothetical protein